MATGGDAWNIGHESWELRSSNQKGTVVGGGTQKGDLVSAKKRRGQPIYIWGKRVGGGEITAKVEKGGQVQKYGNARNKSSRRDGSQQKKSLERTRPAPS